MNPKPPPFQPGELLLHPLAITMLALWIINDHFLKALLPGLLTGKLSDIASLAFFPLLAAATYEVLTKKASSKPIIWTSIAATGTVMFTINLFPSCAWLYQHALGLAQWPWFLLHATLNGQTPPDPNTVDLTMDPTDLWTLPALSIAFWIHQKTRSTQHQTPKTTQETPSNSSSPSKPIK